MSIETRIETITPQKARKWLELNSDNRPLRESYIKRLAAAIQADEWVLNGETIKFSDLGKLSDGQHRLHAVVLADKPIQSLVTRNVPHAAFDTIDRGPARSNSDLLHRRGHVSVCALAAAYSWLWKELNGGVQQTGGKGTMRDSQIISISEQHPAMPESVRASSAVRKLLSHSIGAFCHYQFAQKDAALADKFFAQLADGLNLTNGNPVYHLRETLLDNKGAVRKLRPIVTIALTRKAWNALRTNKTIRCLKWSTEEAVPSVE
jgi:hypothetical protein